MHTAHAGARAGDVLECEIRIERGEVGLHAEARQSVKRLQLRCERERPVGEPGPHEWFLAQPVAREQEAAATCVPERDREHPVEPFDETRPVLLVEVRDDRRVAAAAHVVVGELGAKLGKVVELAVEHGDDVAALVSNRLVAELRVEHLKALMPENAGAGGVGRSLVRPAVAESRSHLVDKTRLRLVRRGIESADPAHAPQCA